MLAFAAPAAALSFYLFFVQFYFLKFATDVLLAAPAVMGGLLLWGRVWDAVSDPLAGYWSDRTRSRWGRRRPWMLAAIPLLALSYLMVWNPPPALGPGGLTAWCALALLCFYSAYTVYSIPHQALGVELSSDHHERTRVFGAQRMAFVLGMMLAFGGIHVATNTGEPRSAALLVAFGAVALATPLLLIAPLMLRERPEFQQRGGATPFGALRDVLRNRHARILLAAWFADGLGGGVLGVLAPFLTQYVLGRPDLIAVIPAFFVVAGVLSIPLWIALSRRFGKRNVWIVALLGNAIFFGSTIFVGRGDVTLLCLLLVGAGASNAAGGALGQSMLADVIDYDEVQSGERKEGAYAAAWGFALKLAIGLVVGITGVALQLSGFAPNVEQTRSAEFTLRGLFAGAPFVAALLSAVVLRRFSLSELEHIRIRAELARRAAAPPPP